ncbi:MAG: hypothetical protein AAF385_05420 [Pseudomonadota bacterium]
MRTKRFSTSAIIVIAMIFQNILTPLASADTLFAEADDKPRLMFYMSKSFGKKDTLASAPQLGFRLEQPIDIGNFNRNRRSSLALRVPIADLRWTKDFGQSFYLLNSPMYVSQLQLNSWERSSSEGSMSGERSSLESVGPFGRVAILTVGALAILCATNTVICEEDDDGDYTAPTIPDEGTPTDG